VRDSRPSCGRRFPARAIYRIYVGKGTEPVDTEVLVIWETLTAFKIKALQTMTLPNPTRELKIGKTAFVSKLSIIFLGG
jgi:hypothetical protein